jgi:hypothetical protein
VDLCEIFGIKRILKTPDIYKSVDDALKLYNSLSVIIKINFWNRWKKLSVGTLAECGFIEGPSPEEGQVSG